MRRGGKHGSATGDGLNDRQRNIIVCLPKLDAKSDSIASSKVAPGVEAQAQAMSAAATATGLDILREQVLAKNTSGNRPFTFSRTKAAVPDDASKLNGLQIYTIDVHGQASPPEIADALLDITGSRACSVNLKGTSNHGCNVRALVQSWHHRIRAWFRGGRFTVGGPGTSALTFSISFSFKLLTDDLQRCSQSTPNSYTHTSHAECAG